jgi:hypothetical protein
MLKVLLADREGERKREGRGWLDFGSRELKYRELKYSMSCAYLLGFYHHPLFQN